MKKYSVLIFLLFAVASIPALAFGAASAYLPDSTGKQLDWEYSETPPKRPKPLLLNSANYEVKWKSDNPVLLGIVQDQNGILYMADYENNVRAVYPNGKLKWSVQLDMGFEYSLIDLKLGRDGTIYAYSSDILEEPRLTSIFALSPEGKVKWKLPPSPIISQFDDHFAGDSQGDFVYFSEEGLVSRNAAGEINWINKEITSSDSYKYWEGLHRSNVFTDPGGNIYVDSVNGEIISLDPAGNIRWKSPPQSFLIPFNLFRPYFSDAGLLYMLTVDGVHALDAHDGNSADVTRKPNLSDIRSSGIPTDGKGGYYLEAHGRVKKINYAGDIIWEYNSRETEKYGVGGINTLVTDNQGDVYFPTGVGNIIGLNRNGQEFFAFLRNAYWNTPTNIVIGRNGNIYANTYAIGLVAFGPKQLQVYLNNLYLPLSVTPIMDNGSVLVPFRSLFESCGLSVGWDSASQTITGSRKGLSIQMTLGSKTAYLNGQAKQLTAAPRTVKGSAYIPLRFVGEALGMNVSWDSKSSSVNIDSKE